VTRLGRLLRRGRPPAVPAHLWYPGGTALARLVAESGRQVAAATVARLDVPVPGALAPDPAEDGALVFWTAGRMVVPAVSASGTLFLTWAVTPALVNAAVAGSGHHVTAFLVLPPETPERTRERVARGGWRIGRPRDAGSGGGVPW
jgi:hypothetical protein